jgi:hypothetical protein
MTWCSGNVDRALRLLASIERRLRNIELLLTDCECTDAGNSEGPPCDPGMCPMKNRDASTRKRVL